MQLIPVLIEVYHDKAPATPVPVVAFGMCHDDERIVVMVYEDQSIKEAA